ncbi:class II aldolase/adducin family protein [Candidatus Poriferisocius sp.]|uniref:class II aldolase/adducin family protein n=1 Tax=Candidatus Poriferisocius sp. TaxID=3101276 RepID=UPI003B59205F
MGKLDEAIAGQSGFPRVMPGLDQPLTVPQKIACAARILDAEGYALDVAGHITVVRDDADDGSMWCTPYGLWWNEVTASDILMIDADGEVLEGRWDVTPAVFIHTEMHRARPDARVVIHNHPYYGSLLSTMHKLPEITDQQACMFDGDIALFGTYTGGVDNAAGGQEMADAVGSATAVILANHGVLIAGETTEQAVYRASNFERVCRLNYDAMQAGQIPVPVPPDQRPTLKAAVNSHHMTVRYFWEGAVRRLLREAPEVLN